VTTTQQHNHRDSWVLRVAADDLRVHAERIEHNKCRWVPGTPQDVPEACMLYTAGFDAIQRVYNADAHPYVLHAIWRVVWEADGGLVDPTVAVTMPAHEVENLVVTWNDRQPSARTVCRVLRSAADLLDRWADDADTRAGATPATQLQLWADEPDASDPGHGDLDPRTPWYRQPPILNKLYDIGVSPYTVDQAIRACVAERRGVRPVAVWLWEQVAYSLHRMDTPTSGRLGRVVAAHSAWLDHQGRPQAPTNVSALVD
jgi:hypothetical protein